MDEKVYEPSQPWQFFNISPHLYRKLRAKFLEAMQAITGLDSMAMGHPDEFVYNNQLKFRIFVAGRMSVRIWEAQKFSIIASGDFKNLQISKQPRVHGSFKQGATELRRLSRKHPEKPFYLFALIQAVKNGEQYNSEEIRVSVQPTNKVETAEATTAQPKSDEDGICYGSEIKTIYTYSPSVGEDGLSITQPE